jgi:mono/diheme cytochrome c family protein
MKAISAIATAAVTALLSLPVAAAADEGDWKNGRLYFRGVCTACHSSETGAAIAPNAMTQAQWIAYLQADSHANGTDSVSQYLTLAYRQSVSATNRVAERFVRAPEAVLMADLTAFLLRGAQDGEAPAGCN